METQDHLEDSGCSLIVFDASAIINLIATGYIETILPALGLPCVIEGFVYNEVRKSDDRIALIERLSQKGLLRRVDMEGEEADFFVELIFAKPKDALHDGEAATISIAKFRNGIPVIDERKARRIASEQEGALKICYTLDLIRLPRVQDVLGPKDSNIAVYNALQKARMQVPLSHEEWILSLLGSEQVKKCSSIRSVIRLQKETANG